MLATTLAHPTVFLALMSFTVTDRMGTGESRRLGFQVFIQICESLNEELRNTKI